MLQSHEKFHTANGKRLILAADKNQADLDMLTTILDTGYEFIFAHDGKTALKLCRKHKDMLSLILLNLVLPVMPGLEVLKEIRNDDSLRNIPVIVVSEDQEAEVLCLNLGAAGCITKPYPIPGIIRARILRTIELSEGREIINYTERDHLTHLYNSEFFFKYADQFDQHHPDMKMDAIVVDICRFHMINERFGKDYSNNVLRLVGQKLREIVSASGGIVCRREADTFLIYIPHRKDYQGILDIALSSLSNDERLSGNIRFRMGVYSDVDKSIDVERRFDRAQLAANRVRRDLTRTIGFYDIELHKKDVFEHKLIDDFRNAIEEDQFKVFYQPKYDIRPDIPVLAGCEALVRWYHPRLDRISPINFIPLFESNGLIRELDTHVWSIVARQIKAWKEKYGSCIPVSVNVSRIDMTDPSLAACLQDIAKKTGVTFDEIALEITESAYTDDLDKVIEAAYQLKDMGFHIHMDDFGTGYSSLNMISKLPIDALKLDMAFIHHSFTNEKDTRMLKCIIEMAHTLSLPVIAEGVETEDQLTLLKGMGCDQVQGYYFSGPVPPEKFEAILSDYFNP